MGDHTTSGGEPKQWAAGLLPEHSPHGYWVAASVIASAYAAAAKFGISLPVADGVITPVWAPTGIALSALLLVGYRLWPAVALAAFLVNATSGVSLALAAGISVGNTLEDLAGAYLLRRFRFDPSSPASATCSSSWF